MNLIRRLDDLGRVLIPKEIRRELSIREGDELAITFSEEKTFVIICPVKKGGEV